MNYRNAFLILILVLVGSSLWWGWAEIHVNGQKIERYQSELDELEKKSHDLIEVQESYQLVRQRFDTKVVEFDSFKTKVLVDEDSYIHLLEQIRELGQKQNVNIVSLSPIREDSYPGIKHGLKQTHKHIVRYPVQVRLLGDYLTIGAFLEQLLALPVTVNIGRVSLETELGSGGYLACELVLYTYMFREQV
jgi:Tfp pilus assembly protein PilO